MRKFKIKKRYIVYFLFIITILSNSFLLAKYYSYSSATIVTTAAKWSNNIEITSDTTVVLDNGAVNSEIVTFNITSNSEVDSQYDLVLNGLPRNIRLDLSNNYSDSRAVLVETNSITVAFGLGEATFAIPSSNSQTQSNGITMNATINSGTITMTFTNNSNDSSIYLELSTNDDVANIIFYHFGNIPSGNQTTSHTATFSTSAVNLPGMSAVELYATIEQSN